MSAKAISTTDSAVPLHLISEKDLSDFLAASHDNPFGILGLHAATSVEGEGHVLRVFNPTARDLQVLWGRERREIPVPKIHVDGFFELFLPGADRQDYSLRWTTFDGEILEGADPYSFGVSLGEEDMYYFAEGSHLDLYRCLGAHPGAIKGVSGTRFAVWAPNARRVSVVGDFNRWDGRVYPMRKRLESGVWEIFIPGVERGAHYKFEVVGADTSLCLRSDPFAFFSQNSSQTASIVEGLSKYKWSDAEWLGQRATSSSYEKPTSIYEVHLGSWKRRHDDFKRPYSYVEAADELVDYVVDMGFTHIELLPVTEFPFDGSWGYQVTGYFAPTSRYGTPDELRHFIDRAHQRGIGVILDWVPAHFPKDAHGLARFDGTALYEHGNPNEGEHKDWGTLIFNFGRNEVQNFLIASALYWLDQFHLDGIRVDAVASMIYRDYSRNEGEWTPNYHGGRENLEAVAFLRRLNEVAYARHPGVLMMAEESTSWGGVSHPVSSGGLGFGYKWNMGWMHDMLEYIQRDPVHRKFHHGEASFAMVYAYTENFVLVLSHDEVVHGKKSLLDKMPGDRWQQFANLRLFYSWMFAHPGKKLLFMGDEIGQWKEWDHAGEVNWEVLYGEEHRGIQSLVRDLNKLYCSHPALHARDHSGEGFAWLSVDAADSSTFAFIRKDGQGRKLYCAINATPTPHVAYRLGVEEPGFYKEIFNSDAAIYSGSGMGNLGGVTSEPTPWQEREHSIPIVLPPLAVVWFEKE